MSGAKRVFDAVVGTIATKVAAALAERLEPIVVSAIERRLAHVVGADEPLGPATERSAPEGGRGDIPETLRSSGVCLQAELGTRRPLEGRR